MNVVSISFEDAQRNLLLMLFERRHDSAVEGAARSFEILSGNVRLDERELLALSSTVVERTARLMRVERLFGNSTERIDVGELRALVEIDLWSLLPTLSRLNYLNVPESARPLVLRGVPVGAPLATRACELARASSTLLNVGTISCCFCVFCSLFLCRCVCFL